MPIDHTSISVNKDLHKKTLDFYLAALKPLDYVKVMAFGPNEENVGLGVGHKSDFWLIAVDKEVPTSHFAFTANGNMNPHGRAIISLVVTDKD